MALTTTSAKRSRKNRAYLATGPGGHWSGNAPRKLREAYDGEANRKGWALWCKHLAKRKLRDVSKLFSGGKSPLYWSLPEGTDIDEAQKLIELLRRPQLADRRTAGLENAALCWLSQAEVAAGDVPFGLECLAWCGALVPLADHLSEQVWWQLTNRLIAVASSERRPEDPLAEQMLHGELPAMLAYQLPELDACQELDTVSRRTLETAAGQLLGDEGMVHGGQLDVLRPLLACWTRWRVIGRELGDRLWCNATPRRYAQLVEHALRLSRPGGTLLFSSPDSPGWNRRLLKTALRLADTAKTRRLARLIDSGGNDTPGKPRRRVSPTFEVESAGIAVMRPDWRRRSPQLAVNYSGPQLVTELNVAGRRLWSGPSEIQVRVDGQSLVGRHAWEQVCWESDRDIDYLELELRLSEDIVLQRHLALAREDGFLFLADAVLGVVPRKIEYRATLPLGNDVTFVAESETREGTISAGNRARARVLPLSLPEWRSGPSCGTLQSVDGALQLEQKTIGRSMFAPLFFDFDRRRLAKEATWRQLTVGEDRQIVPRDAAVGYRVQLGKAQWLIYRALDETGIRTVLGKNLMHEFLLGRFGAQGQVKTLLEIEA